MNPSAATVYLTRPIVSMAASSVEPGLTEISMRERGVSDFPVVLNGRTKAGKSSLVAVLARPQFRRDRQSSPTAGLGVEAAAVRPDRDPADI